MTELRKARGLTRRPMALKPAISTEPLEYRRRFPASAPGQAITTILAQAVGLPIHKILREAVVVSSSTNVFILVHLFKKIMQAGRAKEVLKTLTTKNPHTGYRSLISFH